MAEAKETAFMQLIESLGKKPGVHPSEIVQTYLMIRDEYKAEGQNPYEENTWRLILTEVEQKVKNRHNYMNNK